jgi:hypothetical protein
MHLVAMITDPSLNEAQIINHTTSASVGLLGFATHFDHDRAGLVVNVSRPANHQFVAAVDALLGVLQSYTAPNASA